VKARVTLKDVAAAACVSPMTVSNVINGKRQFVSPRTREIVEREIARLGYRVQKSGQNLKRSIHRSVGMVIVDDSPSFLADPFTASVVAGLSNVLSGAGYSLSVQRRSVADFYEAELFRTFEVDGFCISLSGASASREQMIEALTKLGHPTILFQEPIRRDFEDVCVLRQDDFGGGQMIATHLLAGKIGRAVMLRPKQEWAAIAQREAGLRAGLRQRGDESRLQTVVCAGEELASVETSLAQFVEEHGLPDSVIGANDRMALAAMAFLARRGVAIPERVRIIGFNCFEPRGYVRPLLTTVRSPAYAMGERAGAVMLQRLSGVAFDLREIVLPVSFEPGESA
jgi:LacI family transcriptional regulator